MGGIPRGDQVVEEKDFLSLDAFLGFRIKRIFLPDHGPLPSRSPRLVAREEFLPEGAESRHVLALRIVSCQEPGMVRAAPYPIPQADGRIDDQVGDIGELLFHRGENRFEVDTVDRVMDKLEPMDAPLHLVIIIGAYDDLVERKARDETFIVLGF